MSLKNGYCTCIYYKNLKSNNIVAETYRRGCISYISFERVMFTYTYTYNIKCVKLDRKIIFFTVGVIFISQLSCLRKTIYNYRRLITLSDSITQKYSRGMTSFRYSILQCNNMTYLIFFIRHRVIAFNGYGKHTIYL